MPPIREYLCHYCNHQFEELVWSSDPDEYSTVECRCGSRAKLLPAMIGGYSGVALSGARKKNSSAQKSKKAFTGHPGNMGEPESKKEEQIELEFPPGDE